MFHTEGPLKGQERAFPPVNNFWALSKAVERGKRPHLFSSRPGVPASQRRRRYGDERATPVKGRRRG